MIMSVRKIILRLIRETEVVNSPIARLIRAIMKSKGKKRYEEKRSKGDSLCFNNVLNQSALSQTLSTPTI